MCSVNWVPRAHARAGLGKRAISELLTAPNRPRSNRDRHSPAPGTAQLPSKHSSGHSPIPITSQPWAHPSSHHIPALGTSWAQHRLPGNWGTLGKALPRCSSDEKEIPKHLGILEWLGLHGTLNTHGQGIASPIVKASCCVIASVRAVRLCQSHSQKLFPAAPPPHPEQPQHQDRGWIHFTEKNFKEGGAN